MATVLRQRSLVVNPQSTMAMALRPPPFFCPRFLPHQNPVHLISAWPMYSQLPKCTAQPQACVRRGMPPHAFHCGHALSFPCQNYATGTQTRVARVTAECPNQLDHSRFCCVFPLSWSALHFSRASGADRVVELLLVFRSGKHFADWSSVVSLR